ncbi:MAG: glutamine--tRNA ligase, partial [Thermodesulfobacteriota bacterium]|nr:glutamine--tRNA ligase [Thermodesulfobacteriota bacterium]
IRLFASRIGVDKANSRVSMELLEDAIRDDLNAWAPRVMAVLRPLKVTLSNYPEGEVEWLDAPYWPRDIDREGSRKVPLSREISIERTDFMENPPPDWIRLRPGGEVRLRSGYFIRCEDVEKDPSSGEVVGLRCSYDPESLGKPAKGARKKTAAIQWVSNAHGIAAEVRLFDRLFKVADPEGVGEGKTFRDCLNPDSAEVLGGCLLEPGLAQARPGDRFQFVRHGFFVTDEVDSRPNALVFNRIVALRDRYRQTVRDRLVRKSE